jgi:hypothetical protein
MVTRRNIIMIRAALLSTPRRTRELLAEGPALNIIMNINQGTASQEASRLPR